MSIPNGFIPQRKYTVRVTKFENTMSSKGFPMSKIGLEIVAPDKVLWGPDEIETAGRTTTAYLSHNPKSFVHSRDGLARIGLTIDEATIGTAAEEHFRPGTQFDAMLSGETQYLSEAQTPEDKASGAKIVYILDDAGNKIVDRINVKFDWKNIVGGYKPSPF